MLSHTEIIKVNQVTVKLSMMLGEGSTSNELGSGLSRGGSRISERGRG